MKDKTTLAIIGCDTDGKIVSALSKCGFSVQILPQNQSLPSPVSSHSDMLMVEIKGCVFTEKRYLENEKSVFNVIESYGYNIIPCNVSLKNKYPYDIAFNIAVIGKNLYGNTKYNAEPVIKFAESTGFKVTDIKQGYTKCSTVILDNRAIITADDGIADAANNDGISVLKINNSPDSVILNGYNYGFIGGACGVHNNTVYFTGDIALHPQGKDIKSFCQSFGYNVVSLTDSALVDIGGIIFLPYIN